MNQRQYEALGAGHSQCDLILRRLQMTPGTWVPLPELYQVSGSLAVGVRVADLRHHGCVIEQRSERRPGTNTIFSFYRLVGKAVAETQQPGLGEAETQKLIN